MPPTPPVPAVTITTDPTLPVDMSLATGQDTQLELTFSRGLMWSDFGQNARFTYMYNGELHTNVAAIQFADHFRVMGGNSETIIDIPEWAVAGSVENISLIMGRADWKLIAITYGEDYQLMPQDLVGMKLNSQSSDVQALANDLIGGQTAAFVYNNSLLEGKIEDNVFKFRLVNCNPVETGKFVRYDWSGNPDYVLENYTCYNGSATDVESDIPDWFNEVLGITIQSAEYLGYTTQVPIPRAWCEH